MPLWLQIILNVSSALVAVLTLYWRMSTQAKADKKKQEEERAKEAKETREASTKQARELKEAIDNFSDILADQNREYERRFSQLQLDTKEELHRLQKDIDERRRSDIKDLHNRVDSIEGEFSSKVMEKIGKLDSSIEAMQNTLELIQRHFIENGNR